MASAGSKPKTCREERVLGLERGDDRLGPPETVALALEGQVGVRDALGEQRVDHHLGLVRGHDGVVESLEDDHGGAEPVRVVDGRPGPVDVLVVGPPAHQAIEIPGLELVGVGRQRGEVADAVATGPGREHVVERQGREHREAAGAAATDRQTLAVDLAPPTRWRAAGDAVLDVGDTPCAVEGSHVVAAVAGAAAVVDVDHRPATRGPVAQRQVEVTARRPGRSAVGEHQQRRTLVVGADHHRMCRSVVEPVRLGSVAAGEGDELRCRQIGVDEAVQRRRADVARLVPVLDRCGLGAVGRADVRRSPARQGPHGGDARPAGLDGVGRRRGARRRHGGAPSRPRGTRRRRWRSASRPATTSDRRCRSRRRSRARRRRRVTR